MLENYHGNIVRASCLVCVKIFYATGNFPDGDMEVTEPRFSKYGKERLEEDGHDHPR